MKSCRVFSGSLLNGTCKGLSDEIGYLVEFFLQNSIGSLDLSSSIKNFNKISIFKKGDLARSDDDPHLDLFQSSRARWKRMRTIMNPTFSSAKLREVKLKLKLIFIT